MGLCDEVRESCRRTAAQARSVRIDEEALAALTLDTAPPPALDPEVHFLDGSPVEVASYMLCVDAINFGSGWFPTLRKRAGQSGYTLMAGALAQRWRGEGAWTNAQLRAMRGDEIAELLEQDRGDELMSLYAQGLRQLGQWLGARDALAVVAEADGSAERLADSLAHGMSMFHDAGFYKRAQITAADLALAGVAEFGDLARLTIFADNVVPHVLRCEGVLVYEPELAARIDAEELLAPGEQEREIRACAVEACELLSRRLGIEPRLLDNVLWTLGRAPAYKARPRHRTRCVWY
jgi:hypothetical protein